MGIIDSAVSWAISIANDDSHQYSQTNRNGPNYDCSSFVSHAYKNAGVESLAISNTRTMYDNFTAAGFTAIPYSSTVTLRRGDVLFKDNNGIGHAIMWLGVIDGSSNKPKIVEAQGSAAGILVREVDRSGWTYQWVLRYEADSPSTGPYGYMGETPSAYNSGRSSGTTYSNTDPTNTVVWHATDSFGGGYYDTSGYGFAPYIATLSPDALNVDFNALINARVSGAMCCAGWLYNDYYRGHIPRKEYVNPHLNQQISLCESAGLSYALYAIVRAKTRIEADAECKKLYYVISKYPPKLGLWLYLDMHNSPPSLNEEILDCYYKYITDWGLASKCGLYLDKSRLHQIDWNKYQYKFYLWLDDHITDQHTLDTINDNVLKSEFFEVE